MKIKNKEFLFLISLSLKFFFVLIFIKQLYRRYGLIHPKKYFDKKNQKSIFLEKFIKLHKNEYKMQNYTNIRPNLQFSDNKLDIEYCVFHDMSLTVKGGAISISQPDIDSSISRTGFNNIFTTSYGGSIFFSGHNIALSLCCFNSCEAMEGGQSFFIALQDPKISQNEASAEQISIFLSSNEELLGLCKTTFFDKGTQKLKYLNLSKNTVENEGSCIVSTRSSYFALSFGNFINNTAQSSFWLHNLKKSDYLSKCNIIMSRLTKLYDSSVFMIENCDLAVQYFRFIENYDYPLFVGGEKLVLMYCRFEDKEGSNLFKMRDMKVVDVFFNEDNLKPHDIIMFSTENCWEIVKEIEEKTYSTIDIKFDVPISTYESQAKILYGIAVSIIGAVLALFLIYSGINPLLKQRKLPQALL